MFEQKPVDIDVFNEEEEKIVKERVEKCKIKRREVAEKNKLLKKRKKAEQNKKSEKEMWDRLRELSKGFKDHHHHHHHYHHRLTISYHHHHHHHHCLHCLTISYHHHHNLHYPHSIVL